MTDRITTRKLPTKMEFNTYEVINSIYHIRLLLRNRSLRPIISFVWGKSNLYILEGELDELDAYINSFDLR